jgi:TPR repeat protein
MSGTKNSLNFAEVRYRLGLESENKEEATRWFIIAAENEHPIAQYYQSEYLKESSHSASMLTLFKSAENSYPEAQYELGLCFEKGDGVTESEIDAVKWIRLASQQNHKKAQEKLANILIKFYENVNGDAAYELAGLHKKGIGVVKSDSKCAFWLEKACSCTHLQAMMDLADMYDNGIGVDDSIVMGFQLYNEAAENGCLEAQYHVAKRYNIGRGTPPDPTMAFEWFLRAAKQGHLESQFLVAVMFKSGKGTRPNLGEALRWITSASNQGHEEATRRLKRWSNQ